MGKRENAVETFLHNETKIMGGGTRKFISPGRANVPDRIWGAPGCYPWLVEIKTSDGVLTPGQVREHKRLRQEGFRVITLYGQADVVEFINDRRKEQKSSRSQPTV